MNSWQTFPILSVPNDAPIVEVRNPNHFVQPFVFVAFFVIFVEINPDFMACYEYLMGIVAVLPKIFIIFSAFRPFFRTFR
jgi:hypothetical protein